MTRVRNFWYEVTVGTRARQYHPEVGISIDLDCVLQGLDIMNGAITIVGITGYSTLLFGASKRAREDIFPPSFQTSPLLTIKYEGDDSIKSLTFCDCGPVSQPVGVGGPFEDQLKSPFDKFTGSHATNRSNESFQYFIHGVRLNSSWHTIELD